MSTDIGRAVELAAALHRTSGLLTRALGEAVPATTPAEALVLAVLHDRGATAVGELVELLGLRPSTCTSILDRMTERKLIVRQVRPDDRRSFLVLLTEAGRRDATTVAARLEELADTLGLDQHATTVAALTAMADQLS